MSATILVLPVVRVERDKQGTLATADRSNVVELRPRPRRLEPMRFFYDRYVSRVIRDQDPMPPPAHHPIIEMWLAGLMAAEAFATMPLWPGGIDDLEI